MSPAVTLHAGTNLRVPISIRDIWSYYLAVGRLTIHYKVESEYPVNVYIVGQQGLAAFDQGMQFQQYDRAIGIKGHEKRVTAPRGVGTVYLLIQNEDPTVNTALHYEIG